MPEFANYGDYWWPDLIDVCRLNLVGLRHPPALEAAERERSLSRAADLIADPTLVPDSFDLAHLQAIHRHLFQDVYAWAGQLRVCELVRPDADPNRPGHQFVPPERLVEMAEFIAREVGHPTDWPADTAAVTRQLAALYSSINVLHPFFEGNGRTNRLLCGQAAEAAGHRLEWRALTDHQNDLMAAAFTAGHEPVRRAFAQCVHPIEPAPNAPRSRPRARPHIEVRRPNRPNRRPDSSRGPELG